MPNWWELVISLLTMVGLGILVADKGDRVWAAIIAACAWFLMEFAFVALGFLSAWHGLFN